MRVAGCDPGTSSLDVLVLSDGEPAGQVRFTPEQLRSDPAVATTWLRDRGPFDLIAGPSGYGLPLVPAADCTDSHLALMSLVRPDERQAKGVGAFSATVRAFRDSGLPVVFLPGVVHLPTVPAWRKRNRVDLGTADKLCVAALALADEYPPERFAVVEIGSAFTAVLVVVNGEVVDGVGGTAGPPGWQSGGGWDGEVAYLLSPLAKGDLFTGGVAGLPLEDAHHILAESLRKTLFGLQAVHGFHDVLYSGRLAETEPDLFAHLTANLGGTFDIRPVTSMGWVKHAAQGAAVIADGLAGGRFAPLVQRLGLRESAGTVLDHIAHQRVADVRRWFGLG